MRRYSSVKKKYRKKFCKNVMKKSNNHTSPNKQSLLYFPKEDVDSERNTQFPLLLFLYFFNIRRQREKEHEKIQAHNDIEKKRKKRKKKERTQGPK